MPGFLDGPSFRNVTQKDVMTLMEQIELLLCMYCIHKERWSLVLYQKLLAFPTGTLSSGFISPINGCRLMLQPILLVIAISGVPMLCITDGS